MPARDNCPPRDELRDVIDGKGPGSRKAIAAVMETDAPMLSRKLNGQDGRDIGLCDVWALDRETQIQWLKRYGALLGCQVHEIPDGQLLAELFEAVEDLQRRVALAQVRRPKMAKAEMQERESARKVG